MLVVMSATLEAGPVARFLGGCPGHPASRGGRSRSTIEYRPRSPAADARVGRRGGRRRVDRRGRSAATSSSSCPGPRRSAASAGGSSRWPTGTTCSSCRSTGRCAARSRTAPCGRATRRKVILATNIAETSLTIDGVTTVIDSGLARCREPRPRSAGSTGWSCGRISQASADQRAGRAGRTGPGRCVRLWSEREQRGLAEADVARGPPRRPLRDGAGPARLGTRRSRAGSTGSSRRRADRLDAAERLLTMLGALGASRGGSRPSAGRCSTSRSIPRLGRLLLAAAHDGLRPQGAALAAHALREGHRPASARGAGSRARRRAAGRRTCLPASTCWPRPSTSGSPRGCGTGGSTPARRGGSRRCATSCSGSARRLARAGELAGRRARRGRRCSAGSCSAYPDRVVRRRGQRGDRRHGRRPRRAARRPSRSSAKGSSSWPSIRGRSAGAGPRGAGADRQRASESSGSRSCSRSSLRRERSGPTSTRRGSGSSA